MRRSAFRALVALLAAAVVLAADFSAVATGESGQSTRRGFDGGLVFESPATQKCRASEKGKSKSGGSLVCVKNGSQYLWTRAFSQVDVFTIAEFCSKWLEAALCGWIEDSANRLLDVGPRSSDACQRMFREWTYRIASDLSRGAYVGGTSYYQTSLVPISRSKYPACWNPKELREP